MLTTKDVPVILRTMYDLRQEMVPCFIGPPGIGKTQGIHEFARKKGVKVVTFILSNTVPSEVSGIRMPDKDSKQLVVFDDARMASLEDGDILFFDEILEAPPMLWSSILTLVQDRILASGRKLPDVMIVAASNAVAAPTIIPPSTRDRFMWCEIKFDWKTWVSWFSNKYGYIPPESLKGYIEEDSSEYNILTPRRFSKLWEYYKAGGSTKIIREMFTKIVVDLLQETEMNPASKVAVASSEYIIEALEEKTKVALPEEWKEKSLKELFKAINEMEGSETYIKALEDIEWEV